MNNYYIRLINRIELFCITRGTNDSIRGSINSLREYFERHGARKPIVESGLPCWEPMFYCPNCEEPIEKEDSYCRYCSQALNWEEESND